MFRQNRRILISDKNPEGREHYQTLFSSREKGELSFETDIFPDPLSLSGFFYAQYRQGKQIPLSLLDIGTDFTDGCRTAQSLLKTDPETMIILVSDMKELNSSQQKNLLPHMYFFQKSASPESLHSLATTLLRNWNARMSFRKDAKTVQTVREKIIFDEAGVTERMGNNRNLIGMMMKVFVANIPGQLLELKEKVKDRNMGDIRRMGHTIKGSSATAGAISMQELAFGIENAGKNGNSEEAARLFGELEAAFEEMKKTAAAKGLI